MKSYIVQDTMLILPQYGPDGKPFAMHRNVKEGTLLTEKELERVDVERLLRLGSIALASDDSAGIDFEKISKFNKKTLMATGKQLGLDLDPAMTNAEMVKAILATQDPGTAAAGESQTDNDEDLTQLTDEELSARAAALDIKTDGLSREDLIAAIASAEVDDV